MVLWLCVFLAVVSFPAVFAEVTGGSLVSPYPNVTTEFDVRDFGAVGDGATLNTDAFNRAVSVAHLNGGGLVTVTNGHYVVGAVRLLSNVFLNVRDDAMVLASFHLEDYPGDWPSGPTVVSAINQTNVGIVGAGVIDGQSVQHYSIGYMHSDDRLLPPTTLRPRLVQFISSSYVLVRDVTLQNSPDWTSHYWLCQNVLVDNVTVLGDWRFPNNDGIDPDATINMTIQNSYIDVSDDGICPKTDSPTSGPQQGLDNLLIQDCFIRSRSSAFKVGSATHNNVSNILMQRVTIWDSNRGIGIQHRDQGHIFNLSFINITIVGTSYQPTGFWGVGEPISVTSTPRQPGQAVGTVGRLRFQNITARSENGAVFASRSNFALYDIEIVDVNLTITAWQLKRPSIVYSSSSHDYRPSYEPQVIPAPNDGIYFDNVQTSSVTDSVISFQGPRDPAWGVCVNKLGNANVDLDNVTCLENEKKQQQLQQQQQEQQQQQRMVLMNHLSPQ